MNTTQTGLSSGEVALIAASISAVTALGTQFLTHYLSRNKEKRNLKSSLIADERRIAYLLTTYYKELVMYKVHKQYWYKTSELFHYNQEESKNSHERHFISNEKSFETIDKINTTTAEYFKVITHFTVSFGQNKFITELLENIKSFKPRKASEFSEIKMYHELLKAQSVEEEALNDVYLYYSHSFDKINRQMQK